MWTSHEQVVNMSWKGHGEVCKKLWTSREQIVNKSWSSSYQMKKSLTSHEQDVKVCEQFLTSPD